MHKFIVFAPDKSDEGCFQRRLSVRPTHLANSAKMHETGVLKIGGAILTAESITGADKKMVGSMLIIEAESLAEVKKLVEQDVYYTADVWDPEKLVIAPFVGAHM
ncbi:hypothetical protein FIBSPDRAFT_761378 [Athelia psychrophila]|uniref:YCII-related domain-containing protein n=1 Tax=Athelia psychrophila TaxID=1759441 RepID=A0A165XDE9_9AGAM|nr:hypothetical protein FIBSPDRAFT_761378 [Fibularhizoctonia sp. CBS 109695]